MTKLYKKALKDPYFKGLYELNDHSMDHIFRTDKFLLESGFFDDGLDEINYDLDLLTTPIDKIRNNIKPSDSYVVLLTTGGFAPLHQGHIDIMELAKKKLESVGHCVLGGYFSPSHDAYVLNKKSKFIKMIIEERIEVIEKMVQSSNWLSTDTWEGRYNKTSINFTNVIDRLQQYLIKHVGVNIKVCYVFGSDNFNFHRAFIRDGISVCVTREGFSNDGLLPGVEDSEISIYDRRYFVDNPNESKGYSSTEIRKSIKVDEIDTNVKYAIRYEGNPIYNNFAKSLKDEFSKIFSRVDLLTYPKVDKSNVVSIDPFTEGEYTFDICRIFELSGGQIKSNGLTNRPHAETLSNQLKKIPKDVPLTIVEDDIGSGQTIDVIKTIFKNHNIKDVKVLLEMASKEKYYDVIDCRDFICGSKFGGLVVTLPNKEIARVPYLWPYVSLKSRAKVPAKMETALQQSLWKLNYDFYIKNNCKIKDTDGDFQKLAMYIGFKQYHPMSYFCWWHYCMLTGGWR